MRGAPNGGFSLLICWISARSFVSIWGRPPSERDFQRQEWRKPPDANARAMRTTDLVSVAGLMPVSGHGLLPVNAGSASLVGAQWAVAARRRYFRINLRISVEP